MVYGVDLSLMQVGRWLSALSSTALYMAVFNVVKVVAPGAIVIPVSVRVDPDRI